MNDYVDYVIETSNDNFLEAIEAISRSHKEYMKDDFQQIHDIEASLSEEMCEPGLFYTENNAFQHKSKIYSTALKDNDSDYLNVTDCDFNFMVDPRTGRRLYDNENCLDEFDNDILDHDVQHDSSDSNGDSDCIKIEVDGDLDNNPIKKPLDIPLTIESHLSPKGNKTVLMEIANSPCNTEKSKQTEIPIAIKSQRSSEKYSKPPFSYSCLIAMALKNSESGYLPVSEIYSYMTEKFPYFKTAPDGWKNSVRHNLSLNKCFQKLETPLMNGASRKACLWGLNEAKLKRLNEEISKWIKLEPECTALRLDSKELDERASDDFGNSLLMETNEDQHQILLSSPTSRTAKDRKKFANSKKTKKFDIKVESLNDISQNNALFSEEDQDWDDIDIKPKSTSSYYHYPSDNSQSAFDSSLFKTVRASA